MTRADMLLYQEIIDIMNNGYLDENPRPKYSDGTPAHTYSINHVMRSYDLSRGDLCRRW